MIELTGLSLLIYVLLIIAGMTHALDMGSRQCEGWRNDIANHREACTDGIPVNATQCEIYEASLKSYNRNCVLKKDRI